MGGIEKITDKITADANSDKEAIIAKAEAEARDIYAQFEKKAREIAAGEDKRASDDRNDGIERAKASSKTVTRNTVLEAKSRVIDETFEKAVGKLISLEASEYLAMLCGLLSKTVREQEEFERVSLENDSDGEFVPCDIYTVCLNKKDKSKYGQALSEYISENFGKSRKTVVISDEAFPIEGGFMLVCGDIQIDCSAKTIVNSLKNELEPRVLAVLFA